MKTYLNLVKQVLETGELKENRTGVRALTITGAILAHDLRHGFPLLTSKKMAFKSIKVELEFFIKGLKDKKWLQERGCTIWDEWCNPIKIKPSLNDEERRRKQIEETDLGPIYGVQWRNFASNYKSGEKEGVDQLKNLVDTLKSNPNDRRMLVSAWNPLALKEMALPPCHILFHLVAIGDVLNLNWFQRSCDLMLGIPFNLASYALLLDLLSQEARLSPGKVTGMLSDVHIYENHIEGAEEQLKRNPLPLPRVVTDSFTSIFDWNYNQTRLVDYKFHPPISFSVAV